MRTTVTLDDEAFEFLNKKASNNRSAFINELLHEEKRRELYKAIIKANEEEANDENYQKQITEWDTVLLDGVER